jgi:hypothetical protein
MFDLLNTCYGHSMSITRSQAMTSSDGHKSDQDRTSVGNPSRSVAFSNRMSPMNKNTSTRMNEGKMKVAVGRGRALNINESTFNDEPYTTHSNASMSMTSERHSGRYRRHEHGRSFHWIFSHSSFIDVRMCPCSSQSQLDVLRSEHCLSLFDWRKIFIVFIQLRPNIDFLVCNRSMSNDAILLFYVCRRAFRCTCSSICSLFIDENSRPIYQC